MEPRNSVPFAIISLLFSFMLTNQIGIAGYAMESETPYIDGNFVDTGSYHARLPASKTFVPSASAAESTAFLPLPSSDNNGRTPMKEQDFTTQAALSLTRATQTNNIVSSRSYYDIMFRTTTAGEIKTVEIDFPEGTYVGGALLVEAEGIGPGKIAASGTTSTGPTITYTVSNAVIIPAFTKIRIQLSNINNPSVPSNSLTVSITTRDSSNMIIDGPTSTFAYTIKQIGTTEIADGALTTPKIADNAVTSSIIADGSIESNDLDPMLLVSRFLLDNSRGASFGWNPNGMDTDFIIFDEAVEGSNAVLINVGDFDSNSQCESLGSLTGFFTIRCNIAPPQGSELRYTITNIPVT